MNVLMPMPMAVSVLPMVAWALVAVGVPGAATAVSTAGCDATPGDRAPAAAHPVVKKPASEAHNDNSRQ